MQTLAETAPFSRASALASSPSTVAAIFAVVVVPLALTSLLFDVEGAITFFGMKVVHEDFAAGLFFQKFHPSISLLYLPVSWAGWPVFAAAHALVAALTVWLWGRVAERFGGDGSIAALTVATSPLFFVAAATGQSNVEGLFFLALAVERWSSGTRWARFVGGVVLGASVWSRYEQVPIVAGLGLFALAKRDAWFLGGMAIFPATYLAGGAIYHSNILWFVEFSPSLMHAVPGQTLFAPVSWRLVVDVLAGLFLVTPAWLVPAVVERRGLPPLARWLLAIFGLLAVALFVLPLFELFNFHHKPRYFLVLLPIAALGAGFAARGLGPQRQSLVALLAVAVGIATALFAGSYARHVAALPALALPLVLARAPLRLARPVVAGALVAGALFVLVLPSVLRPYQRIGSDAPLAALREWTLSHPEALRGHDVYTNEPRLEAALRGAGPVAPIRFVPTYDMILELHALLDHANGQHSAVLRAVSPWFYGRAAWPCELVASPPRDGDLFLHLPEERSSVLFSAKALESSTVLVADLGGAQVRSFRGGAPVFELREGYPSVILECPCR